MKPGKRVLYAFATVFVIGGVVAYSWFEPLGIFMIVFGSLAIWNGDKSGGQRESLSIELFYGK